MSVVAQRPPKQKSRNPIAVAVEKWLDTLPWSLLEADRESTLQLGAADASPLREQLLSSAPKRWVAYDPMVLLPSGSFASPSWTSLLQSAGTAHAASLWAGILDEISRTSREPLTRLAVNEGIPLHVEEPRAAGSEGEATETARENVLRSPSGLRMLHGDFGADGGGAASGADFGAAFWVSTKQNGIHQVWAPRWTMFSRGNVKEKARLLEFHRAAPASAAAGAKAEADLRGRLRPDSVVAGKYAVDLYAGIGYFVFSYARLGMKVLCWELNPWSVEGLRRGAAQNRWSVQVVRGDDLTRPTAEVVGGGPQIVVFLEDNREARRRIQELRGSGLGLDVLHINCGFLPSSVDTWRPAREMLRPAGDGWLHLHENVGVADIGARSTEIEGMFGRWAEEAGDGRAARVEHVERVKTFAPDVWHCVFDVYVTAEAPRGGSIIT